MRLRLVWIGIGLLALGCDAGSNTLLDFDGDGSLDTDDCGPGDAAIFPGAPDPYGDDVDQDCDGVDGVDYDGDGYPAPGAGVPADLEDCNDADASIYPGADDPVDATDQDCDGFSRPLELALTPLEPRTSDNLELRVTTDAVIYDVNWSVNGEPRTEFSGFETITAAQTTKGDLWTVEVIAYADGGRSSLPTTASATILNSPPTATLIVGLEPDPREGDVLSAAATVVDDDGDTPTISFIWLVNGVQVNVESLEQLTSADFDKGDEIWAELTPHDGEEAGAAIETNHVFAINTPPSALNAALDPPSGGESSVFSCLVSGWTDPDPADSESYEVQWYVNEGASLTTGDLDGSSFDRGDTVRCEATPNDGEETGASLASGVVTIANTLPSLSAVTLDPSAGVEETTFTCQPTGWLDPDPADASPIYQYQWYVGAPGSEVASVTSETIDGSAFSSGDSIYCEVTPINEFGGSLPAEAGAPVLSSAVVVANSVPQIDSVSIEPAGAATLDHLGVSVVGWTDADGDSPDYLYQWWIDPVAGSLVDGGTAATLDWSVTQRGDEITVEVTPTDGIDSGTMVVGGPITIANTLPGAPVVVIDPSVPSTIEALTCSIATASLDPDVDDGNDSVSYDLSWYEGGNHQPAYDVSGGDATITSVVPASATTEGVVWTCEVTPSDGEGSGAVGTASATPDPTCPSNSFDGVDDHIEMDATLASLLTLGEYWTSEAWFRIDSAPSATAAVFGTTCQWFGAFVGTTGLIRGYRWGSTAGWLEGTTHVADGQWHHVALVVEDGAGGSSNETRLYLDGQLEASDAGGSDMDSQALSEWLLLGANAGDCNSASGPSNLQEYFGGDINSFRHSADQRYDEAFTPEPLLEDDAMTVLLWGAESDANGLIDQSGNGHTGTVVGAAALSGCPSEDIDLDGFASWQDCDDDNDQIYPQAGDTYDDGVDSDCDGLDCGGYPYEGGYYVFCPELKTREDAQSSCESADMDLVSVFGSDELDFIFDTSVNTMGWGASTAGPWIGLQDADLDGTFQWQDGAPMAYENWCNNGAPTAPGSRAYVHLEVDTSSSNPVPCWGDNGSWQTAELEYVCESRHCGPEALEAGETCLSTRDFRAGQIRYLARETGWGSADDEADSFCAAHGYSGGGRVVWPANEDDYVYSYNAGTPSHPEGIYDGHVAPNIEIQREVGCFRTDADGDGVPSGQDCNDADPAIGAWDNVTETASLTSSSKQWTYEYDNPPTMGTSDLNYDGDNGALNDGVESYYGDSLSDPNGDGSVEGGDWGPHWAWWQNSDPSIILPLPEDELEVDSVGFYASCCGGGIGVPSPAEVYHRPDPTSAWTLVGSATPANIQGWSTVPISQPAGGGELKLELSHSSEHTIISELSIQGDCPPPPADADGDGVDSTEDCNDNDPGVAAYCPTCPDGGAYSYNGHDYAFCPIAVDRDSAAAECADMGAHLVKIEDAAENAWLWSTALTEFTSGSDDPWLGANRIATSDWVWHDGTALSPFFPQNQPSAAGDWSDSNRQCLVMVMNTTSSQSTDSFWHPKSCDNDFPYVCEVAIDADGDGVLSDVDCDDNNDSIYPGSDSSCPGTSCLQLLDDDLSEGDGSYWIDPENTGAFQVTCDMTTDGGGWTALTSDVLGSLNDRSGGRQYLYSNSIGWAVSPATNLAWDWNSWAVLSGDYDYGSAGNPASGTFSCSHTNVEYGNYGVGCVETGGPSGWKLYPAGSSANYDSTIGTALICQDFPGSLGSGCVADVQIWFRESDASAQSCSSLAFDNTNNALTSSFTMPTGGYTVEAWVWLNDVGPQPILSSSTMNLGVYGGNDGLVVQYPGHSDLTATNEAVPMNQWTHLVWAYSGSGGMQAANWDFFIDGVLSTGEVRQGASEPPLSGNTVELGSFTAHNCCLTDLDGQLRSIRISSGLRYSTGFTPDAELDSDSTTLVLWDFDGADSGVIADLSGNGYEVTPSSNVSWSPTCPEEDGDSDGVAVWQDCDDSDGSVYPGTDASCPGTSCLQLLSQGSEDDGTYWIDPDGDGLGAFEAYCDMNTDGGGWTLMLAYDHAAGTSPPLVGSTLPTDPENGFSHTSLTELGVPAGSVDDIRFYCTSSLHSRVVHFKTSQASVLDMAYNGSGTTSESDWTGGTTLLDDHTGNLPLATNNAGGTSFAGTFLFYRTNEYHWAIRGQAGSEWWECDDPHVASHDTHHQVWFR